ncbi:hypothetical protein PTKIN_Ptkin13bG0179900 [Pterospermum kingtungense]
MRIWVAIDVRIPLACYKVINKRGGCSVKALFRYERLGTFCFLCGLLGYSKKFCNKLFESSNGVLVRNWSIDLRAPIKRILGQGSSRWLRGDDVGVEQHSMKGQTRVAEKVSEGRDSNSNFVSVQKENNLMDSLYAILKQKNLLISIIVGSGNLYLNATDLNEGKSSNNSRDENSGLDVGEDRKCRRGEGLSLALISTGGFVESKGMDLDDVTRPLVSQVKENIHLNPNRNFLSAGSGSQTYREP